MTLTEADVVAACSAATRQHPDQWGPAVHHWWAAGLDLADLERSGLDDVAWHRRRPQARAGQDHRLHGSIMSAVEAEFWGGPADGRLEAVQRAHDGAPTEVTFAGIDLDAMSVLRHYYRLHADVGPIARYDFDRTEHEPM